MFRKPLLIWHNIRARYHEILIQDCLDESMKRMLMQKLHYHKQKLHEINTVEAP